MSLTALFAAMSCVVTLVVMLPSPTGGYINPGDAIVLLGAFLLGPKLGAVAGGLGSAIADVLSGYVMYAPATLVIKSAMAFTAASITGRYGVKRAPIAAALGELIMVFGYFAYTAVFLRMGWGALPEMPGNFVQGVFGAAVSVILLMALVKIPYVEGMIKK